MIIKLLGFVVTILFVTNGWAADVDKTLWIKVNAKGKTQRSEVANTGVSVEIVDEDYVISFGKAKHVEALKSLGYEVVSFPMDNKFLDFPPSDSNFHNYAEVKQELESIVKQNPSITALSSIGKSVEGREILLLNITDQTKQKDLKPAILFLGTHHAREHLSTEMPVLLAKFLTSEFNKKNPDIVRLVQNRQIFIIPLVNPDGAEFDVGDGDYKMWRKNRAKNGSGTFGVDLNRNYSFGWGTGGSSTDPDSDVYMGPSAFSEPETQAVRDFVGQNRNINIILTFHSFSKLILYPWGGKYDPVPDKKDQATFEKMAKTMAAWNGYKPEQASDLYIASGDTCDWAYGTYKIFAFTFELDPGSMWEGGFYPGQSKIQPVFQKNLKPALYLIDLADNPYRALEPSYLNYGLSSPLVE